MTLQQHARDLARAFKVRLIESDQVRPEEALAIPPMRLVLCAPITERMTYAVALHELGHIVAPLGSLRVPGDRTNLTRDEEDAAWAWARHHALEWTPDMEALAQWAEALYHTPPAAVPAAPAPTPTRINWSDWK